MIFVLSIISLFNYVFFRFDLVFCVSCFVSRFSFLAFWLFVSNTYVRLQFVFIFIISVVFFYGPSRQHPTHHRTPSLP